MIYKTDSYLEHHGIKGQKWGIRRFQNEDGSYKSGAEGRYDEKLTRKQLKNQNTLMAAQKKSGTAC